MRDELDTRSYWTDTGRFPRYPALDRDLDVDAVVVGAGITGLTAAYLLKRSGRRVAVIERMRVGGVDSMATTAHVTCVTDMDLAELVKNFGRDHAQAVWDAGFAAIEQIESHRRRRGHRLRVDGVPGVQARAARRQVADGDAKALAGGGARWRASSVSTPSSSTHAPFVATPGVSIRRPGAVPSRASISPPSPSGSTATGRSSSSIPRPTRSATSRSASRRAASTIACEYVVIATHTPLMGKTNLASATLLQTKLYLYTSYVVGGRRRRKARCPRRCSGTRPIRTTTCASIERADHDFAIFGGDDHKTGQAEDTAALLRALEAALAALMPLARHHASLVGPGRRDQRRAAVHRRERRRVSSPRPATPATA